MLFLKLGKTAIGDLDKAGSEPNGFIPSPNRKIPALPATREKRTPRMPQKRTSLPRRRAGQACEKGVSGEDEN
jgi:hypothetical protein